MAFTMTTTMYIALILLLGISFFGVILGMLTNNPFTMAAFYIFVGIMAILLFPEIHGLASSIEGALVAS